MHKFEDLTHGLKGYLAWGLIACIFLYLSGVVMGGYYTFTHPPTFSEEYFFFLLMLLVFVTFEIWILSAIKFSRETIQELYINDDCLSGYFYFRYQFKFDFSEIASVKDYKVTWAMSRTRTFPQDGMAMQITLKNGATYFISPHMKNFKELRQLLMTIPKKPQNAWF